MNVKLHLGMAILCSAIVSSGATADTAQDDCAAIARLWNTKGASRGSLPFQQPSPNELIYTFDLDRNGRLDELSAVCGSGRDAQCELTLTVNGSQSAAFALPTGIRVIRLNNRVYIVNGVVIHQGGAVEFGNYQVHRLRVDGIQQICK